MNRIILIGNGFDLAHGLATGYRHFIGDLWGKIVAEFNTSQEESFENAFLSVPHANRISPKEFTDYKSFKKGLQKNNVLPHFKNYFLEAILERSLRDWVDIEEEYFRQIKKIVFGVVPVGVHQSKEDYQKNRIKKLNNCFEEIKQLMEQYLHKEEDKSSRTGRDDMANLFFDFLRVDDFPNNHKKEKTNLYWKYVSEILSNCVNDVNSGYRPLYEELVDRIAYRIQIKDKDKITTEHIIKKLQEDSDFSSYRNRFFPRTTLVLNFNYTIKTESPYLKSQHCNRSIHIHGELCDPDNPIIFGYGDELADEYKEIEKLNDNDYLKNVKSIKYLQTANYREMLKFIDSDYYQIYIFGHSCGISDRTLLHTLFEHENCVSIKPFYYQKEENGIKSDDYENIIMNISRNFKDKAALREKVVNKTYCTPLPQNPRTVKGG
ncbi:MAG: bacteriophage abortive infection AbiH family protein [Kiritimatiellaeota bacterium]|nr:bacteriophage abortive infection AbiH family protein [Kiritimatiellota bacterium]